MNTIRSGKIARLPPAIREQLNQRLANHESSTTLLAWLNGLPEVRVMVAQEFGGKAIGKNNIFEWRHGGHAEWRRFKEAREIVERLHADGNELTKMPKGAVVDITAQWMAARYAVGMKSAVDSGVAWEQMREFCHDVLALQREEHRTQRLELAHDVLDFRREKIGLKVACEPHGPS